MIDVKIQTQSKSKVKISPKSSFDVAVSPETNLEVGLSEQLKLFVEIPQQSKLDVKVGGQFYKVGDYEFFKGPYEVKPTFENQTLKTKNMAMKDDVEIKPISVTKVSNQSGGNTVIIGD